MAHRSRSCVACNRHRATWGGCAGSQTGLQPAQTPTLWEPQGHHACCPAQEPWDPTAEPRG